MTENAGSAGYLLLRWKGYHLRVRGMRFRATGSCWKGAGLGMILKTLSYQ